MSDQWKSYDWNVQKECHKGNTGLITLTRHTLYVGGWSRSAIASGNVVIDLTGDAHDKRILRPVVPVNRQARELFARSIRASRDRSASKAWLSFSVPDYGTPVVPSGFWSSLALDVKSILKTDDILIACLGGHGRTGLVACILAGLIAPHLTGNDPVEWLRKIYCDSAVETASQHRYIHTALGLPAPDVSDYVTTTVYTPGEWAARGKGKSSESETVYSITRICKVLKENGVKFSVSDLKVYAYNHGQPCRVTSANSKFKDCVINSRITPLDELDHVPDVPGNDRNPTETEVVGLVKGLEYLPDDPVSSEPGEDDPKLSAAQIDRLEKHHIYYDVDHNGDVIVYCNGDGVRVVYVKWDGQVETEHGVYRPDQLDRSEDDDSTN